MLSRPRSKGKTTRAPTVCNLTQASDASAHRHRSPSNAAHVRVLRFAHPCPTHIPTDVNQAARSIDRIEAWEFAANLLDHMPGIEELVWETGFGVGGALWKVSSRSML